jgi:hypothetical protein
MILRDFRGQMSWGRICSLVGLIVAVYGQLQKNPMDIAHLSVWLGVALGNYGASKVTEMICAKRTVETEGQQ